MSTSLIVALVAGLSATLSAEPFASQEPQLPATTLAELAAIDLLRAGDRIRISYAETGGSLEQRETTVVELRDREIMVRIDGIDVSIPGGRVERIVWTHHDSVINGALIGAAAGGGGMAVFLLAGCNGEYDESLCGVAAATSIAMAGVGALLGMVVDGIFNDSRLVFARSTPGGSRASLVPLIANNRRGFAVRLRF